uniref:Uncharacterized protein n=1 Tax=Monodelphis domestica TaxID=13616 RepID=F7BK18_MONDO
HWRGEEAAVEGSPRGLRGGGGRSHAAEPTPLHLLPCKIQHNGPAAISRFFSPTIRPGPSGPVVSFRGRSLHGEEVTVPPGYVGLVLREEDKSEGSEVSGHRAGLARSTDSILDRTVQAMSSFSSFTLWGLEAPPGRDARIHGALTWPSLATASPEDPAGRGTILDVACPPRPPFQCREDGGGGGDYKKE